MKKIIKEGILVKSDKVYRVECSNCKAIIEYDADEFNYVGLGGKEIIWCPTPQCRNLIDHDPTNEVVIE